MILLKIRGVLLKYHFGLLLAFTFLFVSCSKDKMASSAINELQKSSSVKQYDAEDIFSSIIFLDGNFADTHLSDFSELKISAITNDTKVLKESKEFESSVIEKIKTADPLYLENFKKGVLSGDYETVKSTVQVAATKVYNTIMSTAKFDETQVSSLTKSFIEQYKTNPIHSIKDAKDEIKKQINESNLQAGKWWVKEDYVFAIAIAIAAAVAAVIVAVVGLKSDGTNDFLTEKYLSQITLSVAN